MKCIKEIIYIEDSGRFDQNSVVTTHSHCDQFCFETSSVTVFIAATGHHFQLTVLTFQLTKKHHIHIDGSEIIFKDADVLSLLHQITGIFFYKCGLTRTKKARDQIYLYHCLFSLSFLNI